MSINPVTAHVPLPTPRDYTRAIIREVAEAHGVTLAEILSDYRDHRIVAARRAAILAVIRMKPHLSLPDVGRVFGRDHTTIMHHLEVAGIPKRGLKKRPLADAAE